MGKDTPILNAFVSVWIHHMITKADIMIYVCSKWITLLLWYTGSKAAYYCTDIMDC